MVSLFTGKTLIVNNQDRDELDTERELIRVLENKVLLLFFGAGTCPRCQAFAPVLKEFFVRLTDEFYVERASQLILVYVSLDESEEEQDEFLRRMPKRWLLLPFQDELRRELALRFAVQNPPAVVVLEPNGEVIASNAVDEIRSLGPSCFKNWQEAAELVDRSFRLAEDFDNVAMRSFSDPIRRLKYKLDKKEAAGRENGEEEDGGALRLWDRLGKWGVCRKPRKIFG
uniref:Thioredoxin domain-containing protein n=1 Tax=Sphenodon punctatus TaxID=8508 RepID=A0A8D0GS33_SPHPU